MKGTLDVHRELLARDVAHEIVRLPRLVLDAGELPAVLGVAPERCVTVHVGETAEADLVAVLAPAATALDRGALARLLGTDTVRPAPTDRVNAVTGFVAGLVAPLPLPPTVAVLADTSLATDQVVYAPVGEAWTALGIRAHLLLDAAGARVADLARRPTPQRDRELARRGG